MYRIPYENEQITKTIAAPYAPVDFTEEEKTQFRDNIGAGSGGADETQINDIKMLGWTVPRDFAVQNYEENGVFHQRVDRIVLSSLSWYYYGEYAGHKLYYTDSLLDRIAHSNDNSIYTYSRELTSYPNSSAGTLPDRAMRVRTLDGRLYVNYDSATSVSKFVAAMSGVYLYYELATEIARPVDGYEVTEPPVLLWENASPTSNFLPQTINLNLSNYRFVMMEYDGGSRITKVGLGLNAYLVACVVKNYYRKYGVTTTGISFQNCNEVSVYGTSTVIENGALIPYAIYGIK